MQEQQGYLSPAKSPVFDDLDTGIRGGDSGVSHAGQQADFVGTQVLSYASRIFPMLAGTNVKSFY